MTFAVITQLMAYREIASHVLNMSEYEHAYKIKPRGTLTYYGVVEQNVDYFRKTGRALQPKHRAVVDDLLAALYDGYANELTFQIVLEPIQNPDGYDYVLQHLNLLQKLATELTEYCGEAQRLGKRLGIIVRFGSEMNDLDGTAGTQSPDEFIQAFRAVRGVFSETLPEALFTFSPALRADLEIEPIAAYWPGEEYVDLIGATWYVHGQRQKAAAFAHMREYFESFNQYDLPFSLDEFGGAEGSADHYLDNDCMLRQMFSHIASLGDDGIAFKYAILFVDAEKYGVDAMLRFLTCDGSYH